MGTAQPRYQNQVLIAEAPANIEIIRDLLPAPFYATTANSFLSARDALSSGTRLAVCGIDLSGCKAFALQRYCDTQSTMKHIPFLWVNMGEKPLSSDQERYLQKRISGMKSADVFDFTGWRAACSLEVARIALKNLICDKVLSDEQMPTVRREQTFTCFDETEGDREPEAGPTIVSSRILPEANLVRASFFVASHDEVRNYRPPIANH